MADQKEDKFGRADLLIKELIERKVEEIGVKNPAVLALYGKYKTPLSNLLSNILGPAEFKHPLFQPPPKKRRSAKAKATAAAGGNHHGH